MARKNHFPYYVFVTGGVISGLGKGICTSSLGMLLKESGFKVSVLKVDMYLNIDAGTINPLEHGEVFVTEDGMETDQDLGNYERFLGQNLMRYNYMTMGQVYYDVITKERNFGYAGQDVEGHIHIPEEIIRRVNLAAKKDDAEIILIEVGGTVGEYQNIMFFEAIRRLKQKFPERVQIVHLVYLLNPVFLGELKSKPAQASIYELYKLGLQPNFVICRSNIAVDKIKRKLLAQNSGVELSSIINAPDVDTVYKIPLLLQEQNMHKKLLKSMNLKQRKKISGRWRTLLKTTENLTEEVKIAIIGKYFNFGNSVLTDAYLCVIEAIKHASWKLGKDPKIQWFDVERFEDSKEINRIKKELERFDGIIVPQGWGSRGVEGKILAVEFARKNKIPYLGLCFGMQMAVIEFTRNVLKLKDANSEEANPQTKHPVIHIMEEQKKLLAEKKYGGTIRLGAWPCKIKKGTLLHESYKKYGKTRIDKDKVVQERHRHRYEFNNEYRESLENKGLVISGTSPDGKLVEAVELPKQEHPFFVGVQFHPEYKSRPLSPHPIFVSFIKVCIS